MRICTTEDSVLQRNREYYSAHKKEIQDKHKKYYNENKADIINRGKEYGKKYFNDHKDAAYKRHKKYRDANKEKFKAWSRKSNLKLNYGVSIEDYEKMFQSQLGKCAICGNPSGKRHFDVDHNHSTGRVRGLLCLRCNIGLGAFKENETSLMCAISYLQKHNQGGG